MSGELDNSQAMRDAKRATADLQRAEDAGAPYAELTELWAVKVRADERVAALRRRIEPPLSRDGNRGRAAADLLAMRERRRAELRDGSNEQESPDLTGETGRATAHEGNRESAR